ncbi:MAG: hypothetical protein UX15_C0001G0005 [Parcubacteria group bacterium GW2011_GWA1_45_7]|nr:MAG: hypothetical protein UX14_C0026G0002 [Parcubacteria group bacterium GW2011_GWF1_45_5]KKU11600.1 MAG: hypothetical protein UX15_C0001G0005 [Parcubacteria group bacterium GW2011_GWA1_45_7]KKU47459.1 MAG: hypothetical protein UX66_C0013G0008 [Parcubacteria group bacterium GW2011_GWF2_46_8]
MVVHVLAKHETRVRFPSPAQKHGILTDVTSTIAKIVFRLIANFVAIQIAINYIAGVSFSGSLLDLAKAAGLITLLNIFIKPFLDFILAPLVFLTLGLFSLIINAIMLWLTTYWMPQLTFANWKALLLTTLILTFINYIFDISQQTEK